MNLDVMQLLNWKLRRVAAAIRQQDIAFRAGMSTTRYSAIERGEQVASELEARLIDQFLPPLPEANEQDSRGAKGRT